MKVAHPAVALFFLAALVSRADAQAPLSPHAGNPILTPDPGQWDAYSVRMPGVVVQGGVTYLFYGGRSTAQGVESIGLATSPDGVQFTKQAGPILTPGGSVFDAAEVTSPRVLVDGNGDWLLYYGAKAAAAPLRPGRSIGRAVSTTAAGPYSTLPARVLGVGVAGEWDSEWIHPASVRRTATGYEMYYSAGSAWPPSAAAPGMVGLARSTDGVNWVKYDDPTTTSAPFASSDPVFMPGEPGAWDDLRVLFPGVITDGVRWDMFYQGANDANGPWDLGYASSLDGVRWTRWGTGPALLDAAQPWTSQGIAGASVVNSGSTYTVYYGGDVAIGMATSSDTDDTFLDVQPGIATAGDPVTFQGWQGKSGGVALLFLVAVNGAPFTMYLPPAKLMDVDGLLKLGPIALPAGLAGLELTFQTFSQGRLSGKGVSSNLATLEIY